MIVSINLSISKDVNVRVLPDVDKSVRNFTSGLLPLASVGGDSQH